MEDDYQYANNPYTDNSILREREREGERERGRERGREGGRGRGREREGRETYNSDNYCSIFFITVLKAILDRN